MATMKKVIRPKFYSEELSIKEKVMVSVISNKFLLQKYGEGINKTLQHHVNKLEFFMSGEPSSALRDLNLPLVTYDKDVPTKNLVSINFIFLYYIH